jgi:nucleotide-binding universal stress UspA family protein
MTADDFPQFAVKQTKGAHASRLQLAPQHAKQLDELIWGLAENPGHMAPLSRLSETGKLVYKDAATGLEVTYSVDMAQKVLYFYHFSAPLPPRQTIFISYSRTDVEWLQTLRKFLTVLEREGIIRFWDDSYIKPGEPWEESIRQALDSSCAAVLLVSQDFLASPFITKYELPRLLADARRGGKKIFWVPISPSTVFDSNEEIAGFESLVENPRVSLIELSEAEKLRTLVEVSRRLRDALG